MMEVYKTRGNGSLQNKRQWKSTYFSCSEQEKEPRNEVAKGRKTAGLAVQTAPRTANKTFGLDVCELMLVYSDDLNMTAW